MRKTREVTPYQDTMTGHPKDQDQGQAGESQYVTIQQAAQLCGVSSKTIQRAIHAGTLPARYPLKNRCEIAVSDLERLRPGQMSGHPPEPLEQRVATLEQRVQQLEQLVAALQNRSATPKSRKGGKTQERTTGPLPKQFVSLLAFAALHGVAEARVQAHADIGLLPVRRGAWTDADGTNVTLALDAKGKAAFFQVYQGVPPFVACDRCPH